MTNPDKFGDGHICDVCGRNCRSHMELLFSHKSKRCRRDPTSRRLSPSCVCVGLSDIIILSLLMFISFYRAVHYIYSSWIRQVAAIQTTIIITIVQSAVLRLYVVRLSVCPSFRLSVTLVDQDHIGWKSWKLGLIARTISRKHSLFVAQRPSTYYQGNMGKFRRD